MSELVFVGTSDAFGAGGRRQSAYLLRDPRGAVLLDCGTTTSTGLENLGIERDELDAIVLSHYHADHFGGVPQLLLAATYIDRRRRPLVVAGPRGVEARVREVARALGHPLEEYERGFEVEFVELPTGDTTEVGPVSVTSFATRHTPQAQPHGLVVAGDGPRVAYSGDTGWFDALPQPVAGSALFVCECTLVEKSFEYHLSLEELSDRKGEFDCGRVVLTHLGAEMRAREQHAGFEVADDGQRIAL